MNNRGVLLLAALLVPMWAAAQFAPTARDARSGAMGGCLLMPVDTSVGWATVDWRQGYLMQGMATRNMVAGTRLGNVGHLAAGYSNFGDADYHEQQAVFACGMKVVPWLTLGVYGIYSNIGTSDAHYRQQHWLDGGVVLQVAGIKNIDWGGYFVANSRRWDESRPYGLRAGITYRLVADLLTVVELSVDDCTRLRCGMEYAYRERYFARVGLSTNPLTMTFGLGCRFDRYHIDLGTEVHPVLGLSPQISLGLCL